MSSPPTYFEVGSLHFTEEETESRAATSALWRPKTFLLSLLLSKLHIHPRMKVPQQEQGDPTARGLSLLHPGIQSQAGTGRRAVEMEPQGVSLLAQGHSIDELQVKSMSAAVRSGLFHLFAGWVGWLCFCFDILYVFPPRHSLLNPIKLGAWILSEQHCKIKFSPANATFKTPNEAGAPSREGPGCSSNGEQAGSMRVSVFCLPPPAGTVILDQPLWLQARSLQSTGSRGPRYSCHLLSISSMPGPGLSISGNPKIIVAICQPVL